MWDYIKSIFTETTIPPDLIYPPQNAIAFLFYIRQINSLSIVLDGL